MEDKELIKGAITDVQRKLASLNAVRNFIKGYPVAYDDIGWLIEDRCEFWKSERAELERRLRALDIE